MYVMAVSHAEKGRDPRGRALAFFLGDLSLFS